jgi:hypothetical protein
MRANCIYMYSTDYIVSSYLSTQAGFVDIEAFRMHD